MNEKNLITAGDIDFRLAMHLAESHHWALASPEYTFLWLRLMGVLTFFSHSQVTRSIERTVIMPESPNR